MSRKASEVLLSIEADVKQQRHYLNNIDMLLKHLVQRVGAMEQTLSQPLSDEEKRYYQQASSGSIQLGASQAVKTAPAPAQQLPGLKPSVVLAPDGTFNNVREPAEEYEFEPYKPEENLQVESNPQGQRRDARYTSGPVEEKKVPVQQQVIYASDDKNVCLASVEIFNSQNKLISSSKTNNTGKWTQMLPPGRYAVSISKKATATKPPVQCSYFVDVPKSNEPILKDPVKV